MVVRKWSEAAAAPVEEEEREAAPMAAEKAAIVRPWLWRKAIAVRRRRLQPSSLTARDSTPRP